MHELDFKELIETLPSAKIRLDWDGNESLKYVIDKELFTGDFCVYFDAKIECESGETPKIEIFGLDVILYETGEEIFLDEQQIKDLTFEIITNLTIE